MRSAMYAGVCVCVCVCACVCVCGYSESNCCAGKGMRAEMLLAPTWCML